MAFSGLGKSNKLDQAGHILQIGFFLSHFLPSNQPSPHKTQEYSCITSLLLLQRLCFYLPYIASFRYCLVLNGGSWLTNHIEREREKKQKHAKSKIAQLSPSTIFLFFPPFSLCPVLIHHWIFMPGCPSTIPSTISPVFHVQATNHRLGRQHAF